MTARVAIIAPYAELKRESVGGADPKIDDESRKAFEFYK